MKSFIKLLFILFISFGEINLLRAETKPETQILADLVSVYNSISETEDISARIKKKEFVLNKIDEIKTKYSATDIGITLLSTDSFGGIDVKKFRDSYLKDLTTFSLKTCESNPTSTCLGFVSLDNGNKACENANSLNQYIKASNNFKNAYRVFKKDKKENKYNLAVISSYTRCADLARSEFGKDFINSRFIGVLLEKGDLSRAKGITQNMKTPIFKILSATDIRINEDKFDLNTFNLLLDKISKIEEDSFANFEKSIVTISLINKFLISGGDPFVEESILIKRSNVIDSPFLSTPYGIPCNKNQYQRGIYVNDIAMDSIFLLKEKGYEKNNIKTNGWENISASYFYRFLQNLASSTCNNNQIYKILPINKLLKMNLIDEAKELRSYQKDIQINKISYEKAAELQVDFLEKTLSNEDLISFYKNRGDVYGDYEKLLEEDKVIKKTGKFNRFLYPFVTNKSNYIIFKSLVKNSDICLASKKLFREIRGREFESDAVLYLIKNKEFIDSNNSCGDSDLDLLIN